MAKYRISGVRGRRPHRSPREWYRERYGQGPFDIEAASGQQRQRTAYQESLRRAAGRGRLLTPEEAEGLRQQSPYHKIYKNLKGEPEKQRRLIKQMRTRGIAVPEQWEIEHGVGPAITAPAGQRQPYSRFEPGYRLQPEGGGYYFDPKTRQTVHEDRFSPRTKAILEGRQVSQQPLQPGQAAAPTVPGIAPQIGQPETFLPPTWDEKMRRKALLEAQLEDEIKRGGLPESKLFEDVASGGSEAAALPAADPMLRSALEADAGFQDAVTAFKPWQDIMTDPAKVGLRKDAYPKWKAAKDKVVKQRQRVQDELRAEAKTAESQEAARATSIAGALETMTPEEQKERLGLLSTEDRVLLDKYHPVLSAKAAKEITGKEARATKAELGKSADSILEELPDRSELLARYAGKYSKGEDKDPELEKEIDAAFSADYLEELQDRFVRTNQGAIDRGEIDEEGLREIFNQRFRAKRYRGVKPPSSKPKARGEPTGATKDMSGSSIFMKIATEYEQLLRSRGVPEEDIRRMTV